MEKLTAKAAKEIIGTLGFPSKMPGTAYGIPATACNVGQKLHNVPDTVCSDCYALKANYRYESVVKSQETRLASLANPRWVEVMAETLLRAHGVKGGKVHPKIQGGEGFHRWHDAGDIQSLHHLEMIAEVARRTPSIRHWLPTREVKTVAEYMRKHGEFPVNLTVRISATKINGAPSQNLNLPTSSVYHKQEPRAGAHVCPAYKQGGFCADCRACWQREVAEVAYPRH